MKALDRLRQHGGIPDAYSWASVAISTAEAAALVDAFDGMAKTIEELRQQLASAAPRRCTDCGRSARKLTPVFEDADKVSAWLGPGCYRKHLDALRDTALGGESCFLISVPIGGAR